MKRVLALLAIGVLACGKRGDPKPPVPIIPKAASDLVVTQRATKVLLSWSYPALTTSGKSLTGVRRVTVYRYTEDLPVPASGRDPNQILPGDIDPTLPQPVALFAKVPPIVPAQFAKLATRLDSIEAASLPAASVGAKLTYEDTPPFRSKDGRPVRVSYAVVTEGQAARSEFSNLATIVPLDVAVPPAGVTASAKPEGVTLSWTAPTQAATGGNAPVIAGYNIYRVTAGGAVDTETPINTAPVTKTTYLDVPPYGAFDYRVTAVASAGPPRIESEPSAAANTTFKDLVPPPAPATVTALIETRIVRLLWDAVDSPDLDGYNVYRVEGKYPPLLLTPHPARQTHFGDESVDIGIAYYYQVTAVDKAGNESKPTKSQTVIVPKTP